MVVPPSGGSLEIGNGSVGQLVGGLSTACSPFGGIPRNWKLYAVVCDDPGPNVPPSGGSLEIGNHQMGYLVSFRRGAFPLRGDP